ncbi:MAG: SpoVA/SpoVAEb family sporulation membrane protein [Bacilli bacterium]|nr:SpoVA/SpoVAEb family sporulation membrane protein [Bacilli bacterium]
MTKEEYKDIVKKHTPKIDHIKSMSLAFFIGGFIGMIGQVLIDLYINIFNITIKDAGTYMIVTLIFISSLLTSLGFFDKIVEKVRCGIIVPITGFAHAMTSAAIEYRKDGLIMGLGSNIFKITGSVILYGIISAYIFGLIRIIIGG